MRGIALLSCFLALLGCGGGSKKSTTSPPTPVANDGSGTGTAMVEEKGRMGTRPAAPCTKPDDFGPAIVSDADYAARRGAAVTKFSEVPTSIGEPLEECGVRGEVDALTRLSCDDGTNPFPSGRDADNSRAGSMGAGGRCGSIIDMYEVPCPERKYEVYIDMYICRSSDQFM